MKFDSRSILRFCTPQPKASSKCPPIPAYRTPSPVSSRHSSHVTRHFPQGLTKSEIGFTPAILNGAPKCVELLSALNPRALRDDYVAKCSSALAAIIVSGLRCPDDWRAGLHSLPKCASTSPRSGAAAGLPAGVSSPVSRPNSWSPFAKPNAPPEKRANRRQS
jgi:hypothetical protein